MSLNNLTGDFDVVVEFTLIAANRVLAAMHSGNRFPHSLSLWLDDNAHSKRVAHMGVDVFGSAIPDPKQIAAPRHSSGSGSLIADPVYQKVDPLANPASNARVAGAPALADYGHLQGIAQLQLGPPTLTLPPDSGSVVNVTTTVMARYIANPETMAIPDFLRGEIQISVSVDEITSPSGTFMDVHLEYLANNIGNVQFTQFWPALHQPPSASEQQHLTAITRAIRNTLVTSFQPSTATIPDTVLNMLFKTMTGDSQAIAVLLNMRGGNLTPDGVIIGFNGAIPVWGPPSPDSMITVFLKDGDDFAFAVSNLFLEQQLQPMIDKLKAQQIHTVLTSGDYTSVINDVTIEFQDGRIHLTANGRATTDSSWSPNPNFDFTVTQDFTLQAHGDSYRVIRKGDPQFSPHAGILTGLVSLFKGEIQNKLAPVIDQVLNQANPAIEQKLSIDANLGDFLNALTNQVALQLTYTSFEIKPVGIILHGSLSVPAWPPAVVEFAFGQTPDLQPEPPWIPPQYEQNALNSWIPGGTIGEFVWTDINGAQVGDEVNRFVLRNQITTGLHHLCLTIKGTRISATDSSQEDVTATACQWSWPIDLPGRAGFSASADRGGKRIVAGPDIALTQLSPSGRLEVVGATPLWPASGNGSGNSVNLIVHFPDQHSLSDLSFLSRGVMESGRADTATVIVVVLTPHQLGEVKPVYGVMFSDDTKAWAHLLGTKEHPATFLLGTTGEVEWYHEGALTTADLAKILRTHLLTGGLYSPHFIQSPLRIGQKTPNFLFESAAGQQLTLRKLAGRGVTLIFYKNSVPASLEAVQDLPSSSSTTEDTGILLAISDGESAESASRTAKEHAFKATVIPDPLHEISSAYGINIWPTMILLNEQGVVTGVHYGRTRHRLVT
jgi:peroxiredoxin